MPAAVQPAIHSLYAFMRTADDFADENRLPGDESERLGWLASWQQMLADCEQGRARHPIFIALRRTLETYHLPASWLSDLLHAFTLDVTVRRYAKYTDVLDYCRFSANPVGRLILTLCGYRDEAMYHLSDAICTGLQLANHWQDVAIDLVKDRIYLPAEDRDRFGVSEGDLNSHRLTANFQKLMTEEVERARDFFANGRSLPELVRGRLRWELRATWQGGMRILDKIRALNYDVLNARPVVTRLDWGAIALKSLRPC